MGFLEGGGGGGEEQDFFGGGGGEEYTNICLNIVGVYIRIRIVYW